MFWDRVAWAYDLFAEGINRKADRALCAAVERLMAPSDAVLECACGTGLLTAVMAPRCRSLVATDFSERMLRRAEKKCSRYGNVHFEQADILHLPYPDASFAVRGDAWSRSELPRIPQSMRMFCRAARTGSRRSGTPPGRKTRCPRRYRARY